MVQPKFSKGYPEKKHNAPINCMVCCLKCVVGLLHPWSVANVQPIYERTMFSSCSVFLSHKLNELHNRVAAIKYAPSRGGLF